jgi:hypothetical protein
MVPNWSGTGSTVKHNVSAVAFHRKHKYKCFKVPALSEKQKQKEVKLTYSRRTKCCIDFVSRNWCGSNILKLIFRFERHCKMYRKSLDVNYLNGTPTL